MDGNAVKWSELMELTPASQTGSKHNTWNDELTDGKRAGHNNEFGQKDGWTSLPNTY